MKEQIKGFNEAYKIAKKLRFEDYFILPKTTWKQAYDNFKKGMRILDKTSMMVLQERVNIVINSGIVPVCEDCGNIFSAQEYKAGFRKCEHCAGECGCKAVLEAKQC